MHACLVTQSCPTLCDPMGRNLPGSSGHGILQERILELVAISYSIIAISYSIISYTPIQNEKFKDWG